MVAEHVPSTSASVRDMRAYRKYVTTHFITKAFQKNGYDVTFKRLLGFPEYKNMLLIREKDVKIHMEPLKLDIGNVNSVPLAAGNGVIGTKTVPT